MTATVTGLAPTANGEKIGLSLARHLKLHQFLEVGSIINKAFHESRINADYRLFEICPLTFAQHFFTYDL
jgi:hypothetical protein